MTLYLENYSSLYEQKRFYTLQFIWFMFQADLLFLDNCQFWPLELNSAIIQPKVGIFVCLLAAKLPCEIAFIWLLCTV